MSCVADAKKVVSKFTFGIVNNVKSRAVDKSIRRRQVGKVTGRKVTDNLCLRIDWLSLC